ncbi:MAG: hypothetical protein NT103_00895 [Campylobacterales bacterium]|nr:hypothetical protein [Campylobacterales bacterium]
MKKIFMLTILAFLAVSASADYVIFETRGIDITQVKERKVLYIGGYLNYQKQISEIQQNILKNSSYGALQGLNAASADLAKGLFSNALNGVATGIGIGAIISAVEYVRAQNVTEIRFVKVESLTLADGSTKIFQKLLIADFSKVISENEAIEILNK